VLGPLEAIEDGRAKEFTFGVGIAQFRMFVVRRGEAVYGYVNQCPHYSLPLNHHPDKFLTRAGDKIMCTQHLALFRIEDGACLDGACEGRALDPVPVEVRDGQITIS
jgi:nitrite reductase/ring-hydroxylating ferredoxin subunit